MSSLYTTTPSSRSAEKINLDSHPLKSPRLWQEWKHPQGRDVLAGEEALRLRRLDQPDVLAVLGDLHFSEGLLNLKGVVGVHVKLDLLDQL